MKTPRKALIVSYALFAVAVVAFIAAIAMDPTIHGLSKDLETVKQAASTETTVTPSAQPEAQQSAPEQPEPQAPSTSTTAPDTVKTQAVAPQSSTGAVVPEQKQEGGHIPFTNQPVTAGDPQSYVGTVGQCPFYEMAGEKGCVPPPDIECNADWSVCTYKGDKAQ